MTHDLVLITLNWLFKNPGRYILHHTSSATFEAVPTLEAEIRQHQKEDEKLQEIRELLKKGRLLISERMIRVLCGTRTGFVCQRGMISRS